MATETASAPAPMPSLGWRCLWAVIGAATGLVIGGGIWLYNWFTGQHVEVLVTTVMLMAIQGCIGFFVPLRKAAWMDAILYFITLNFLDT